MKFKKYLIHLLGGYTKSEYDFMAMRPVAKFKVQEQPIRILRIKYRQMMHAGGYTVSDEWVQSHLANELTKKMLEDHLIIFTTRDSMPGEDFIEVQATLKLVEPAQD